MFRAMWRRCDSLLVDLALSILRDATVRMRADRTDTIELRLALRVLRAYGCEAALLTDFWEIARAELRLAWQSGHIQYAQIAAQLSARGLPHPDHITPRPSDEAGPI